MPTIPLFPLRAVLFPGSRMSLHIFEDRYRALMRDLLAIDDPRERTFGIVAIRLGSETGPAVPELFAVGTLVQLTAIERSPAGTYDIEVVGRERFRLAALLTGEEYLRAEVDYLPEAKSPDDPALTARTRTLTARYRDLLSKVIELPDPQASQLSDPGLLAFATAATTHLSLLTQQAILSCDDPAERLRIVNRTLADEIVAIQAIPSVPAADAAPPRWPVN